MSMAWGITDEDIATALMELNIVPTDERVVDCVNVVDMVLLEKAVLYYTDFDEQCAAAHTEIVRQLGIYFS